jgi:pimeloyl-ACP methyl ester carboxylesterase
MNRSLLIKKPWRRVSVVLILAMGFVFPCLSFSQTSQTDAPSRFALFDGMRVHYKSYGKGRDALVFIHCWAGDLTFWREQVAAFEGKARLVLIDLPGHGQSDKPEIAYTQDLFARAINAVLRDARVRRAVLIGNSMGTPVARHFYRKYPEKTRAIVTVDGSLRPLGDKAEFERFLETVRGAKYQHAVSGFIDSFFAPQTPPAIREEIKAKMLSTPQHVMVSAMEGMMDAEVWKQDKIDVPLLSIFANMPYWPPDNEQFLRSIAPNLTYKEIDSVGHFPMLEKPGEFNEILRAFLSKVGS